MTSYPRVARPLLSLRKGEVQPRETNDVIGSTTCTQFQTHQCSDRLYVLCRRRRPSGRPIQCHSIGVASARSQSLRRTPHRAVEHSGSSKDT